MIRSILRPWRAHIAVIALLLLLTQSLDVVPPIIVQKLVDEHFTPGVAGGVLWLGVLYFAAILGMRTLNAVALYLIEVAAQGALHQLRVRLFSHLQTLPMSYYDRTPLGDIISRGTADVETVDTLFSSSIAVLVSSLLGLLTTGVAMGLLSLPLSIVTVLTLPLLIVITQFFRLRVREAERANRIATGLMNMHLQETISGIEVIRAFRREPMFVARFRAALRQVVAAYNRSTLYTAFYPPLMALLSACVVSLLLWLGAGGVMAGWGISVGTLAAFVLLFRRTFTVISDLGDEWQSVQSALSGLERIEQVLAVPSEQLLSTAQPLKPDGLQPAIALRDVTFGYAERQAVLHGVSLSVRPGEHVALVGRTGAGKTSTLHLLAGLYDPWSGTVRVAGRDPRALSPDERRSVVGVVPQTVQLFSGTVYANLTLGDATVARAQVERAARIAGADEFIRSLGQGYETPLSGAGRGGGAQLSAGQRQLLALARALVWNPAVLLLDEATAAVDNASDTSFRAALRADAGSGQRAVLTVAHRLSTAREADRVLLMEAGRIIEEGPPAELIARGGRFAALIELEAAGWDWRDSAPPVAASREVMVGTP